MIGAKDIESEKNLGRLPSQWKIDDEDPKYSIVYTPPDLASLEDSDIKAPRMSKYQQQLQHAYCLWILSNSITHGKAPLWNLFSCHQALFQFAITNQDRIEAPLWEVLYYPLEIGQLCQEGLAFWSSKRLISSPEIVSTT